MGESIERGAIVEVKNKPRFLQMITRHAERLPSGELSPAGIAHAKAKGERLGQQAEVLKGYASDHASKRAFDTSENISEQSGITSGLTGKRYATRYAPDIQYDVLKPDLYHVVPDAKLVIETATLDDIAKNDPDLMQEINEAVEKSREAIMVKTDKAGNPMMDIEKLPKEIQIKIGPVRQKYQRLAFEYCLNIPEVTHRMAIGLAHELVRQHPVIERYARYRDKAQKIPEKDVILNTTSHGMFVESLLKEAGIYVKPDGTEVHGIVDFENPEFGGFIQPAESVYLEIDDPSHIPERIPVIFEGEHRPKGKIFIDREKLRGLDRDYQAWHKK